MGTCWLQIGYALAMAMVAVADEPADAVVSSLRIPAHGAQIALRDTEGDGRADLLIIDSDGFSLRRQRPTGTFPTRDDDTLAWPGDDVGWDLADLDGDGDFEVLLLDSGNELVVHDVSDDGHFGTGRVLLEAAGGTLPRGLRRVRFVRDVDGDGRGDVVVPAAGNYRIFLARDDGDLADPLEVAYEAEVRYSVGDREGLHGRFGQDVRIPWFSMRDVNGDGLRDLASETEDVALFHIANPDLPREASWRIDVAALKEESQREGGFDLDNLFANLDDRVTWRIVDLDGKLPNDLIIQQGGTFRIYLGGSTGDIDRVPDQVLKSSGNVLHYLVRDVLSQPGPELQIIRGDKISFGQVVRWLIIPGALHFDVYTYANDAGELAKKPTQSARVTLEIPRILAFAEDLEELKDDFEARTSVPARKLDLGDDGRFDDVVDVAPGKLLLYEGAVPVDLEESLVEQLQSMDLDSLLEVFILNDLDRMKDGSTRVIDLADIRDLRFLPGYELRKACQGRQATRTIDTAFGDEEPDIHVTDVTGNGHSDVVLVGAPDEGSRTIQIVVLP